MIIRNSMTSILRTRKKTALFFLLILLLSTFMGMAVSIWAANRAMMRECDENYRTIGVISYMGAGYPDDSYLSEESLAALTSITPQQVEEFKGTLQYQPGKKCLGYIEGLVRKRGYFPYEDKCVLVLTNCYATNMFQSQYLDNYSEYIGETEQFLYTLKNDNKVLVNFSVENLAFEPEREDRYLMYGTWLGDVLNVDAVEKLEEGEAGQARIEEALKAAERYQVGDNGVKIQMADMPEQLYAFHQNQTSLEEGDFYEITEGSQRKNVCMVTSDIAGNLGLQVGDTFPLMMIPVEPGMIYDSYNPGEEYLTEEYEIVGIFQTQADMSNQIYIPYREDVAGTFGFEVGQVLLKNGTGDAFTEYMEACLSDNMIVDIYDQGYTQVMDSMKSLNQTALILLMVCGAASLTVLILFGYLFVFKQRESVLIMRRLGTERRKIYTYLMVSCGVLVVSAALAGAIIGFGASHFVTAKVMGFLENGIGTGIDSRYSYLDESMKIAFRYNTRIPFTYFLLTALALVVVAVAICLAFSAKSLKPVKAKKKRQRRNLPKQERKSSTLPGVVFRHSLLSIRRGGWRTWVVCLVSGTLMLMLCVLAYTSDSYRQQKRSVQETTKIEGYFTNLNGKRISGVGVEAAYVRELQDSGYVEDIYYSMRGNGYNYYFLGIPLHADGRTEVVEPRVLPPEDLTFTYYKLQEQESRQPFLVQTNGLSGVGEFFYQKHPQITWLEGYDDSIFSKTMIELEEQIALTGVPCLISEVTMEKYDVSLGDTIRLGFYFGSQPMDFYVVGFYSGMGTMEEVLTPPEDDFLGPSYPVVFENGYSYDPTFDTVRFTLADASRLLEFKDYLMEAGFSQVKERNDNGDNHENIVLKDTQYQKTIRQLDEKMKYTNLLYPVLYGLTGLISFLVSYLMIHNRRGEAVLMQSMGTPKWKVFFAFFLEQALLSLAGILAVWLVFGLAAGFSGAQGVCMVICAGCYLAGCALSVAILNRSKVLKLLQEKE